MGRKPLCNTGTQGLLKSDGEWGTLNKNSHARPTHMWVKEANTDLELKSLKILQMLDYTKALAAQFYEFESEGALKVTISTMKLKSSSSFTSSTLTA